MIQRNVWRKSRRAYYKQEDSQPPGAMLVELARALAISTDELFGLKPVREVMSPRLARLKWRLQTVEMLPAADQKAVLRYIDSLNIARSRLEELDQRNKPKKRRVA